MLGINQKRLAGAHTSGRIKWIDCAKFISMCGVVVDHTFNVVHNNLPLWYAVTFSTGVFVLLSGISARLTCYNNKYQGRTTKRLLKFGGQYAVATALVLIWRTKVWDLRVWISCLLGFNAEAHFYFLLFFFQLVFISPLLLKWCCYCGKQKKRYMYHIGTLIILGMVSSICIRYTYVLPVHGGGQYLFGGTYLMLYYLGMVLEDVSAFSRTEKQRGVILLISGIVWFAWWKFLIRGRLPFDKWMQKYWGDGGNPPSVNYIVFSTITLLCLYCLFSLLEQFNGTKWIINAVALGGGDTIYTFMYHMLILDIILSKIPALTNAGSLVKWVGIFVPMVILPVIAAALFRKILIKVQKAYLIDVDEQVPSNKSEKCEMQG